MAVRDLPGPCGRKEKGSVMEYPVRPYRMFPRLLVPFKTVAYRQRERLLVFRSYSGHIDKISHWYGA